MDRKKVNGFCPLDKSPSGHINFVEQNPVNGENRREFLSYTLIYTTTNDVINFIVTLINYINVTSTLTYLNTQDTKTSINLSFSDGDFYG